MVAIYVLFATYAEDLRVPMYVGATKRPKRRQATLLSGRCHNEELRRRISEVLSFPDPPVLELVPVEWARAADAPARERHWLEAVRSAGWRPANIVTPRA